MRSPSFRMEILDRDVYIAQAVIGLDPLAGADACPSRNGTERAAGTGAPRRPVTRARLIVRSRGGARGHGDPGPPSRLNAADRFSPCCDWLRVDRPLLSRTLSLPCTLVQAHAKPPPRLCAG
ncbi:hypothetical protein VTN00DRAFT_4502 [Thermoascus crustaceus]|uniref:uncharacterized protein n=1 Tax=Thermoascus crustaceus TaxID=5088 RepID=UPI0037422378